MKTETMSPLEYYKHIDNGGISICFDIECGVPSIKIGTQYHGLTSVSATISGYELNPSTLRDIAGHFNKFADIYEKYLQEPGTN